MSEIRFTTEQESAISLRDRNLLVSASAGTGKTAVLVERIIRMATDPINPVDLDRMLVVTFTNAASAEMKERIRGALYRKIKENPGNDRLRRQLILLGQASISTIHAFCSDVIRSNYHQLDIDPGFSVCDSDEADRFLRESIINVLEKSYEDDTGTFKDLVDSYGRGRDDEHLLGLMGSIYKKIRSMPAYKTWLLEKAGLFKLNYDDFGKSIWGNLILKYSADRIKGYIGDIEALFEIIDGEETLSGYFNTLTDDKSLLEMLYKELRAGSWDSCSAKAGGIDFHKLTNAKKGAPENLKNIVKDTRNDYKEETKKIKDRLSGDSKLINENLKILAPLIEKFTELLLDVDSVYKNLKNKNGVVDYGDLEHYALECLESEAGAMYRDRFDEVFVDEYQDSNRIQESIINLVAGRNKNEKNLFMVGDVKQSIYRFRQAEPDIFVKKYNTYCDNTEEKEVRVRLFRNYRSRKPILDFSNYLFSRIMSKSIGEIDYDRDVYLKQGRDYPDGNDNGYPVEIKLVCGEDKDLFTKDIKSNAKEAAVVGGEIIKLIDSRMLVTDRNTGIERPVEYGDITILHRSANSISAEYIQQLKKMGIPVYSESDTDFFNEREIIIIRSFLEVIDNPRRDIPLIALLRSSIFGFNDKELALIRCGKKKVSYYDSMISFSAEQLLVDKIQSFLGTIERFRNDSYNKPMHKLIWTILNETGFYYQCMPGDNPAIRQQNLRRFFEIASKYENGRESGLFGFIRYLDNYCKSSGKEGTNISGSANAVRLMSVHKSKGLEFPVVILSGCGKLFNKAEIKESLIFDRDFGFGPDYIDSAAGYKLVTAVKKSFKIKKDLDGLAEEMRVLYVALTRACEKLVIIGYVKNIDKSVDKWNLRGITKNDRIDPGKVMLASNSLDWVMSGIIQHRKCREGLMLPKYSNEKTGMDDLEFNIEIIQPDIICNLLELRKKQETVEKLKYNITFREIKERFNWEYPYFMEGLFHKKVSVTEIKKLREVQVGEKDIFGVSFVPRPDFLSDGIAGAAQKGTALHNIIAAADLKRVFEPGYINGLFKRIGIPDEDISDYSGLVNGFFRSELGKRMASAEKIETEKAFLYPMKTKDLYPGNPLLADEKYMTIVQGVIDCMFYEKDGIVIIDYKSDNVSPGDEQAHSLRYSLQLDLYAKAVTGLTGIPVKEKYIYFLRTKCSVCIND